MSQRSLKVRSLEGITQDGPEKKKIKISNGNKENLAGHQSKLPLSRPKYSRAPFSQRSASSNVNAGMGASSMKRKIANNASKNISSKVKVSSVNRTKQASSTTQAVRKSNKSEMVSNKAKKDNQSKMPSQGAASTAVKKNNYNLEELNNKFALFDAEVKKLPKWDIKRKGEIYKEGFGLLPLFRQSCLNDLESKEVIIQQVTENNRTLQSSLTKCNDQLQIATTEMAALTNKLDVVQKQLAIKTDDYNQLASTAKQLTDDVQRYSTVIVEKDAEIRQNETIRRRLHNEIQELKGNIRVYCRVRPLLRHEGTGVCPSHIKFDEGCDKKVYLLQEACLGDATGRSKHDARYDFAFDKVFGPTCSQESVFEEISQLVQSVLDGYNVCVFAYGQTGSGKTYTMEGYPDRMDRDYSSDGRVGVIPRAVSQIFNSARDLITKGWKYDIEASFLEIYNETIRDLLSDKGNKDSIKHEIKLVKSCNGNEKRVIVTNAEVVQVKSEKQVHQLLQKASRNRATAATKCNEHSSRSHSIFRLNLIANNELTGESCEGTLNLVDLAGSERVHVSGATGDRLDEAKSINKSLSNLSTVILALANKNSHIPYRNSKLTYLLQNSLGGNSKTLMFVNISPSVDSFNESLNSLRFATKVNNCHIGTAHKKLR